MACHGGPPFEFSLDPPLLSSKNVFRSTHNRNNEFILCERRWQISKRGESEIGLEFERNGFDECKNFSEGSFKLRKVTQVIREQGAPQLELVVLRVLSSI